MATSPSSDVDEVRRHSGEAPSTTKPSSPTTTTLNSNAALDALDDDDNVVRSQVVLMLGDAVRDPSPLFDLARQIESEAWRCFALKATVNGNGGSSSTKYRAKARTLAANLRRNQHLRNEVLSGKLAPQTLVTMTSDQLATDSLREMRVEMNERLTRKRTRSTGLGDAIETNKYKCEDCFNAGKQITNNCAYYNLQNHRDVRKNETWGSKDSQADDGRVLVRCMECKAEWNEATL